MGNSFSEGEKYMLVVKQLNPSLPLIPYIHCICPNAKLLTKPTSYSSLDSNTGNNTTSSNAHGGSKRVKLNVNNLGRYLQEYDLELEIIDIRDMSRYKFKLITSQHKLDTESTNIKNSNNKDAIKIGIGLTQVKKLHNLKYQKVLASFQDTLSVNDVILGTENCVIPGSNPNKECTAYVLKSNSVVYRQQVMFGQVETIKVEKHLLRTLCHPNITVDYFNQRYGLEKICRETTQDQVTLMKSKSNDNAAATSQEDNLQEDNLQEVNSQEVNLQEVNLQEVNLQEVNLQEGNSQEGNSQEGNKVVDEKEKGEEVKRMEIKEERQILKGKKEPVEKATLIEDQFACRQNFNEKGELKPQVFEVRQDIRNAQLNKVKSTLFKMHSQNVEQHNNLKKVEEKSKIVKFDERPRLHKYTASIIDNTLTQDDEDNEIVKVDKANKRNANFGLVRESVSIQESLSKLKSELSGSADITGKNSLEDSNQSSSEDIEDEADKLEEEDKISINSNCSFSSGAEALHGSEVSNLSLSINSNDQSKSIEDTKSDKSGLEEESSLREEEISIVTGISKVYDQKDVSRTDFTTDLLSLQSDVDKIADSVFKPVSPELLSNKPSPDSFLTTPNRLFDDEQFHDNKTNEGGNKNSNWASELGEQIEKLEIDPKKDSSSVDKKDIEALRSALFSNSSSDEYF